MAQPTLSVADLDLRFKTSALKAEVTELLAREHLLDVVVGQFNQEKHSVIYYLITEYGSIMGVEHNFKERCVTHLHTSDYVKKLVGYKLRKIVAASSEELSLCMLIEHDCLMQIKTLASGSEQQQQKVDILNQ